MFSKAHLLMFVGVLAVIGASPRQSAAQIKCDGSDGSAEGVECALLVSDRILRPGAPGSVLRYDAVTGEYVEGFIRTVPGTEREIIGATDLEVDVENGHIYVGSHGEPDTGKILRYDLQGRFIDVFIPNGFGGMGVPAFLSFGPGGPANRGGQGSGDFFVALKDRDAVLRYGLGEASASMNLGQLGMSAAAATPAAATIKGGPLGTPGTAEFLCLDGCPVRPISLPNIIDFDIDKNLFITYVAKDQHLRYAGPLPDGIEPGSSGDLRSACFDIEEGDKCRGPRGAPGTAVFVPAGDDGPIESGCSFGPDGNIYCGSGFFDLGRVLRYAGPLTEDVERGSLGDNRGACFDFVQGAPCAGPLGAVGSEDFVPERLGGLERVSNVVFDRYGNLYANNFLGRSIMRYAGSLPLDVQPGDPADARGACAGKVPGSQCPGPLANLTASPHTAEFIPRGLGGLNNPWTVEFVDLAIVPEAPANDDCTASESLSDSMEQTIPFDTRRATTDGPDTPILCGFGAGQSDPTLYGADLWFDYVAPVDGLLTLGTCEQFNFDTFVAVYGGGPTCECPIDSTPHLACDDDGCGAAANANGTGSLLEVLVTAGSCYKIRVGGWNCELAGFGGCPIPFTQRGTGELNLSLTPCVIAEPPQPTLLASTNRYLTLNAGFPGRDYAVRVTFADLPGHYAALDGKTMWVGEPKQVSENGASVDPTPGSPNFWAAELTCDPHFMDWTTIGDVHAYGEMIIPGGRYEIQAVDAGCGIASSGYSLPISLFPSDWADVAGPFDSSEGAWADPDGSLDLADVLAVVASFASSPTAPRKARSDLGPEVPDLTISVRDILRSLDGFVGLPYPFQPSTLDPCPK